MPLWTCNEDHKMTPAPMSFLDPIYGNIAVSEPVISSLVNTPAFDRLRGVDMAGYSRVFYPGTSHSRFEHSLGVFWLLRRFGASIEEQIHGLLHDISHTAFSHAADFALASGSGVRQDYQDSIHEAYLESTSVPAVLERYGYSLDDITDASRYKLQERDLPYLCADRIDYALRGFYHYGIASQAQVHQLLGELRAGDGEWYFESLDAAETFASCFALLDDNVLDSLTSATMFMTVADCLKYALDRGHLSLADLHATDDDILAKMKDLSKHDTTFARLWGRMNSGCEVVNDPSNYESKVSCKSRIVDPYFRSREGRLQSLSSAVPSWTAVVENGLRPKTYYLRYVDTTSQALMQPQ